MIKELVTKTRSYRRFFEDEKIEHQSLLDLVDLARLSASGGNLQPLKFILSNKSEKNAKIFPHLSWAGYIIDWPGPAEDERPAAYIIILGDLEIRKSFGCDHGIAAQSMLLGATEMGFGGCIIGTIDRDGLRNAMEISKQFEILLVLALGKPQEKVVIEPVGRGGDMKYWRDDDGVHHVPKRALVDIIIE